MEGLRRQRELRRSGKHFEEGRVKEVANKTPGATIQASFACFLAAGSRCLACTSGFMNDKDEQPWCSRRKIASVCLSSPLALD